MGQIGMPVGNGTGGDVDNEEDCAGHEFRLRSREAVAVAPLTGLERHKLVRTVITLLSVLLWARSPAGKPIDRVSHHTQQTYYSRVRRYNLWKPLLQPIIAKEIDARKSRFRENRGSRPDF